MAIPVKENSTYQVNNGYKISLVIEGYEYESDIKDLQIITSLNSAYPIYIITLNLRPIEVIQHKIFGNNDIILTINHIDYSGNDHLDETYMVTLTFLSGDFVIPNSNQILSNSDSLQDLTPYRIHCVPKYAFEFMTTTFNKIFRNSTICDIYQYISADTIDYLKIKYGNIIKHEFDALSPYVNKKPIPQIVLPPTIIKNHFDYLLNEFGMFLTWGCIFASISESNPNSVKINALDIGYQYEQGEIIFYLRQLANDMKDEERHTSLLTYGTDNFYIYSPIKTKYIANTTIGNSGNNIQYIHKPIDKFVRLDDDEILMNELSALPVRIPEYIHTSGKPFFISDVLENRKKYIINHICHYKNEKSKGILQDESWTVSTINKTIMNLSQVTCKLEKHIPIFKFTNIGKTVIFESETLEYKPYNGKYILFSSVMNFKKSSIWEMSVEVKIIRPLWSMAEDDK